MVHYLELLNTHFSMGLDVSKKAQRLIGGLRQFYAVG